MDKQWGSREQYWNSVKKVQNQCEHGGFWVKSSPSGNNTILQAGTVCQKILSFGELGSVGKKVDLQSMKTFQFSKLKSSRNRRELLGMFSFFPSLFISLSLNRKKRRLQSGMIKKILFFFFYRFSFVWSHCPCRAAKPSAQLEHVLLVPVPWGETFQPEPSDVWLGVFPAEFWSL